MPWARAADNRRVGRHTPAPQRRYAKIVAWKAHLAHRGSPCATTQFVVSIVAFASIPPSWPKAKRQAAEDGRYRITSFDVDNLAKLILDGMESVVYQNDRQVVRAVVDKGYAVEPRVVVRVEALEG